MAQIFNIIQGWKNYLKNETDTNVLKKSAICENCPEAIIGTYEKFMPDESLKEIQGLKCDKCKCPLSTKLRSENETCPLGKW